MSTVSPAVLQLPKPTCHRVLPLRADGEKLVTTGGRKSVEKGNYEPDIVLGCMPLKEGNKDKVNVVQSAIETNTHSSV